MLWTLGAAAVVFFVIAVGLGTKLLQVSDKEIKERRRLHEMSRQRRNLGREMGRTRQRARAAETWGQQMSAAREEAEILVHDLTSMNEALGAQLQKLGDKYATAMQRIKENERDPHYENGCAKVGAFRLEEDAWTFAHHLEEKSGESMTVYPCRQCREYFTDNVIYHVGHRETRAMRMAELTRLSPDNLERLRSKTAQ